MAGGVYGLYDLLDPKDLGLLSGPEVQTLLDAESLVADAADARRWAAEPGVVVLDGRDARDYESGHLPGALSLPWAAESN